MNFLESLKGAIKNLKGNKIRSFLTMLGIIIGISSVITMSAIGRGGQQNIIGDLKEGDMVSLQYPLTRMMRSLDGSIFWILKLLIL